MRYHLTPAEWLSLINPQTTGADEDVEKGEPFCLIGGNADWCGHCGKQYWSYVKKFKMFSVLIMMMLIPFIRSHKSILSEWVDLIVYTLF